MFILNKQPEYHEWSLRFFKDTAISLLCNNNLAINISNYIHKNTVCLLNHKRNPHNYEYVLNSEFSWWLVKQDNNRFLIPLDHPEDTLFINGLYYHVPLLCKPRVTPICPPNIKLTNPCSAISLKRIEEKYGKGFRVKQTSITK